MWRVYYKDQWQLIQYELLDFVNAADVKVIREVEIKWAKHTKNWLSKIEVLSRKPNPFQLGRGRPKGIRHWRLDRYITANLARKTSKPFILNLPKKQADPTKIVQKTPIKYRDLIDLTQTPFPLNLPSKPIQWIACKAPKATQFFDYASPILSQIEWDLFQELKAYQGCFQHMILLNPFQFWKEIGTKYASGKGPYLSFPAHDFIVHEFFRHKLGIATYSQYCRQIAIIDSTILHPCLEMPNYLPTERALSWWANTLQPEDYLAFFHLLVQECLSADLISTQVVIADGCFIHSWAGDFTKTKEGYQTDSEAGFCIHNKKVYGKGFMAVIYYAYCGSYLVPVYFDVFAANKNENKEFGRHFSDFLTACPWEWKFLLYDCGACSVANRRQIKAHHIQPIIPTKKNTKSEPILELARGKYFCEGDMPEGISLNFVQRLLDIRARIEQQFSPCSFGWNMKAMNHMGEAQAICHVAKYCCLQLLTLLTAFKVNRPDLIGHWTAFPPALRPS